MCLAQGGGGCSPAPPLNAIPPTLPLAQEESKTREGGAFAHIPGKAAGGPRLSPAPLTPHAPLPPLLGSCVAMPTSVATVSALQTSRSGMTPSRPTSARRGRTTGADRRDCEQMRETCHSHPHTTPPPPLPHQWPQHEQATSPGGRGTSESKTLSWRVKWRQIGRLPNPCSECLASDWSGAGFRLSCRMPWQHFNQKGGGGAYPDGSQRSHVRVRDMEYPQLRIPRNRPWAEETQPSAGHGRRNGSKT